MVNMTDLYNSTNIAETTYVLNQLSGGMIVAVIIIIQWLLIFLVFRNWDTPTIMIINSFTSCIITFIFFVGLGWIDYLWFIGSIGALIISGLIRIFKRD